LALREADIPQKPIGKPGYTGVPSSFLLIAVDLSSKSEYALLALLELVEVHDQGEPLHVRQIASQQGIPDRYLEQLLATLRRAGLVRSQRGSKGGYLLARAPRTITVFEVVNCIEGGELGSQSSGACRTLDGAVALELWQEARCAADRVLQCCSLQDLADRRAARRQLDIMYYI
jgi:Rrf2 family protein